MPLKSHLAGHRADGRIMRLVKWMGITRVLVQRRTSVVALV